MVVLIVASIQMDRELRALPQSTGTPTYGYRVVRAYPHDPQAFTQGLIYRDGFLYESTGLNGRSSLRKVRLQTGEVLKHHAVDPQHFAEGLTDWGRTLLQLTWRTNVGFVYHLESFSVERMFHFAGEGWGLTHDRTRLIMSDGTSTLRFLDPTTLRETTRLLVKDGGVPVPNLNELEFIRGEIYANLWQTDRIARISPRSGQVLGWIDLRGLLTGRERTLADVLNGTAYDAAGDRLFVTGKLWPSVFHIALVRQP